MTGGITRHWLSLCEMRYLPVAPLSTTLTHIEREIEAHDADERLVAALVRTRLRLDKSRGWILLSGLLATAALVVGVGASVHNKLILGVLAPLVASVPFAMVLCAERFSWLWFEWHARSHGLSSKAARKIYDGALGAEHWIGVLTSCGKPPSDAEVAHFVTR